MENNDINNEKTPNTQAKGSSGTGALSSIIFLIIVVVGMIILAHFKGN
jgi:hypothetical protein